MKIVNADQPGSQLSILLEKMLAGEEIVIARDGRPMARLVPYDAKHRKRIPGQYAGLIQIPDDFFDPLPQDVIDDFYGKDE